MSEYKLVPVEKLKEWEATINTIALQTAFDIADDIAQYSYAPTVQGEPVGEAGSLTGARGFTTAVFESRKVPEGTKLYTYPQPTPDMAGLVEVLETALFGTPLDDVPNRDNDDIWSLCYPHLPERASDALRDHLVRIETTLASYRKGGE